jgi:small subunit ribosomal protein S4
MGNSGAAQNPISHRNTARPARPAPQEAVRLRRAAHGEAAPQGLLRKHRERQFHGIYVEAGRMKGDTGENLIGLLERRLDTVVYRAKFVATMFAARQFINHGHVKVNGRRVNISSYKVKVGDLIEVKESLKQLAWCSKPASFERRARLPRSRSRQDDGEGRPHPHLSDVPFAVRWSRI